MSLRIGCCTESVCYIILYLHKIKVSSYHNLGDRCGFVQIAGHDLWLVVDLNLVLACVSMRVCVPIHHGYLIILSIDGVK